MTGREYNNQFSEEELRNEIWKDILGYEGYYQVSNLGRVKSINRRVSFGNRYRNTGSRVLSGGVNKGKLNEYFVVLSKNGIKENKMVHRLVLLAFVGCCPENMECCHNDGIRSNNRLSNLRWDTHSNNILDKIKHGTYQYGENNAQAVLSNEDVLEIRKLYKTKKYSQRKIAFFYNTDPTTIHYIVNNKTWKHLL